MAGKTKKRQSKKQGRSKKHVMTIPQLRKAFEHVETFIELHHKKSKPDLVRAFKEEWKKTFKKEIDIKEAEAYVEHALEEIRHKKPHERKHSGGAMALAGAPILQDTRPGLYISPGVNQGSYAQVPAYVDSGFWNPEIGRQYDPVPGQTHYPAYTPYNMGSNKVSGGGTRKKTRQNKQFGGDFWNNATQFLTNPFPAQPVPSTLNNITSAVMAKSLPQSPDPSQTHLPYASNLTGANIYATYTPLTPITSNITSNI